MRGALRSAVILGLAVLTAGCDSLFGPGNDRVVPLERLPRELTAHELDVIAGSNAFAFGILRETLARDTSPNVFLSPLSASMALGMTLNGARAGTFDGMRDALGFGGLDQDAINASYASLIDLLLGLDRTVEMRIGNSVWARSGVPFHATFMDAVRASFDAEVASLDFSAPDASSTINDWVSRSTNGRIEEIVPSEIPLDIVMYLINAIYFKGSWTEQFDARRTQDASFHLAGGGTSTVRMMSREPGMHYYADADVEIAELRYGAGAFVMDIVLPRPGRTVDDLVATLDDARWTAWLDGIQEANVALRMPKYRIEYETLMNDALVALGMEDAFDETRADFSGMSPRPLFISMVKQKTFVNVDEEGTEAAAATAVGMTPTSMPPTMVVDRPFLVAIRERFSGTILFIGRIGAP